ncbi:hypothetical protein [Photobacterium sanguinicancri]|uniref:hypothetical protein n=1 Tax=Photobacterium sanguinicancri TaxID=875932 RepID=UPI000A44CE9A
MKIKLLVAMITSVITLGSSNLFAHSLDAETVLDTSVSSDISGNLIQNLLLRIKAWDGVIGLPILKVMMHILAIIEGALLKGSRIVLVKQLQSKKVVITI